MEEVKKAEGLEALDTKLKVEKQKKTRVMDEAKLKQLAEARKRAYEVRLKNKAINEKDKALQKIEKVAKQREIEQKYEQMVDSFIKPESKPIKKKQKDYSSSSSSDSEEEARRRRRKHRKHKAKYSSSSEDDEPRKEKQMVNDISQSQLKQEMDKIRREMARKMMFSSGY